MKSIRKTYGIALAELGEENKDVVVLDADLSCSTMTCYFAEKFPNRFFNFGVAEQNMMSTAAGFAFGGKIPFVSTFAMFASGRAWDQVRNSIAYPKANVKIVATHSGISIGPDGATHQATEDIALMCSIPNMVVISPCDDRETKEFTKEITKYRGPVYMRICRPDVPDVFDDSYKPRIGKGVILKEGTDVSIIATGIMVSKAIKAAETLKQEGISAEVINISTIKPIDNELIIETAKRTGAVLTCEDHSIIGGLGSRVAEVLSKNLPTKMDMIGVNDTFGESGDVDALLNKYGLNVDNIVLKAKKLLENLNPK